MSSRQRLREADRMPTFVAVVVLLMPIVWLVGALVWRTLS